VQQRRLRHLQKEQQPMEKRQLLLLLSLTPPLRYWLAVK
jgi:hypothetical protein